MCSPCAAAPLSPPTLAIPHWQQTRLASRTPGVDAVPLDRPIAAASYACYVISIQGGNCLHTSSPCTTSGGAQLFYLSLSNPHLSPFLTPCISVFCLSSLCVYRETHVSLCCAVAVLFVESWRQHVASFQQNSFVLSPRSESAFLPLRRRHHDQPCTPTLHTTFAYCQEG